MRINAIVLWAVMLAALFAGAWLLISPSHNRQSDLERQWELMDSVTAVIADIETVTLAPANEAEPSACESFDSIINDIAVESVEGENEAEEPTAPIYEPLDLADFPGGITPIGILTIDGIDLALPVMEGVDERELRIAPGRVPQTAQVGETGNAVIVGHRNYAYGSMFNRLGEMEIGDTMRFQAMSGEIMDFEVFEILEITPENQIAFIQPQHESIITLYTCTPVRVATHRLLVRARIIEGGFLDEENK